MSDKPRSELEKILRNTASVLLGSVGGEALSTYAVGLSAVSLGPAGFGILAAARAFTEPFQSIAGFGMHTVAITLAAKRGHLDSTLRGTVFYLSLVFSVIAVALSLVFAIVTGRGGPLMVVALATVATALVPVNNVATLPFQYERTMSRVIYVPSVVGLFRLATAWVAWKVMRNPTGFQLSVTTSAAISAGLTLLVSARYYGLKFKFDRALAKELLLLSWPAASVEFVVMAYTRASYFFLHDAGAHAQGEYAAADLLSKPILTLAGTLMVSALPSVAQVAQRLEFVKLTATYRTAVFRAVQILLPLATVAWVLAPLILRRFAPAYASAVLPFRVLLVGTLAMCLNQLSSTFIVAMGRFRLILGVSLANFAVYVAVARWAVPRFGASGAAMATAIMESTNTLLQLVVVAVLLRRGLREPQPPPSEPEKVEER